MAPTDPATDPATARALLSQLSQLQPAWPEAGAVQQGLGGGM